MVVNGDAADVANDVFELEGVLVGELGQHAQGNLHHVGADAVAG
jgi:hypothetical protein